MHIPNGWTAKGMVNYTVYRDENDQCMVEAYPSGRLLVHPEAAHLLALNVTEWGVDSARPTWGVVRP